jgi:hypothetical protein
MLNVAVVPVRSVQPHRININALLLLAPLLLCAPKRSRCARPFRVSPAPDATSGALRAPDRPLRARRHFTPRARRAPLRAPRAPPRAARRPLTRGARARARFPPSRHSSPPAIPRSAHPPRPARSAGPSAKFIRNWQFHLKLAISDEIPERRLRRELRDFPKGSGKIFPASGFQKFSHRLVQPPPEISSEIANFR